MAVSTLFLIIGLLQFVHGLVQYVVYPTNKKDVFTCSQINNALINLLGQSQVQIYNSQSRQTTEFWLVQALDFQTAEILRIPGVDAVIENVIVAMNIGGNLTNSTGSSQAKSDLNSPIRPQRDAPQDLDLVSWPPRKRLPVFGKMPYYKYDIAKGTNTYIYIIDNGLNKDNTEFKSMPWPPEPDEWHYAYGVRHTQTDDSLAGHGSCVASKAAGWKTGVSKNSRLVVMKSSSTIADINFAFAAALDDIVAKKRQGRAVVVYPSTSIQTFGAGSTLPRNWQSVGELIQELFAQDVVVVTGAGNNAASFSGVNTLPAILGLNPNFPLIVAGAVATDGNLARFSQGAKSSLELLWAPGANVECANGPSQGLAVRSGTSFAAGMVAGLAAYELTGSGSLPVGSVSSIIRSRLLANSRPIYPLKGPYVIWNGESGSLDALAGNETAQLGLNLVQGMQNVTLVSGTTNATQGGALVA